MIGRVWGCWDGVGGEGVGGGIGTALVVGGGHWKGLGRHWRVVRVEAGSLIYRQIKSHCSGCRVCISSSLYIMGL